VLVRRVADRTRAAGEFDQRLLWRAADAFRVRVGAAEDFIELIADHVVVRGVTALGHPGPQEWKRSDATRPMRSASRESLT
jgi:hypothetical protein